MPKISDARRAAARQRLIDATTAVATRDGIEGLTTRAIVAEAGVSAGMFYGHFDSKEALLAAVVDSKVEELTTLVDADLQMGVPLVSVMRDLLRNLVVVADLRILATFRAATGTEDANDAQREINRRIVAAFEPLVHAGVDSGVLRHDVDAAAVVEVIDLLIDGVNRRRQSQSFVTTDERVTAVIVDAIEKFLLNDPYPDSEERP